MKHYKNADNTQECHNPGFAWFIQEHWVDLIELNILFVLFSLPVFTIPAAIMGLAKSIFQMQRAEFSGVFREYIKRFPGLIPRSVWPGLFMLLGASVCAVGIYTVSCETADHSILTLPLLAILFLLVYVFFSMCRFVLPMAAILDLPMGMIFRNALILSISEVWSNLAAIACIFFLNLFIAVTSPYTLPFLLLIHFSFCTFVSMLFAKKGICQCIS